MALYQFEIMKKHGAGKTPWQMVDVNITIDGVLTYERVRVEISESRTQLRASPIALAETAVIDAMVPDKTLAQINQALPEFNI